MEWRYDRGDEKVKTEASLPPSSFLLFSRLLSFFVLRPENEPPSRVGHMASFVRSSCGSPHLNFEEQK